MIYSFKTLIVSAMLFFSSLLIVGAMYLPLVNGDNGFKIMEDTFNSLRKGITPPFEKIEEENNKYLGKNFSATLNFRDSAGARTATMMFLRNKLTVTPKGRTVNIQGDLGYTLKFFKDDIYLLYMNRFDALEQRYSMPAINSMFFLDRILKKLAISLASQKMTEQEKLVQKIREKLLIPSYNLRSALPISETSGFAYLALGTLGILLFAILWDLSNFFFFSTLASNSFMKEVRILLGREMSEEEKLALEIKRKKRKQKMAALKKQQEQEQQGKKVKSKRTNKEALKKEGKPAPKAQSPQKTPPQNEGIKTGAKKSPTTAAPQGKTKADKKTAAAAPGKRVQKTADKTGQTKKVRKAAAQKRPAKPVQSEGGPSPAPKKRKPAQAKGSSGQAESGKGQPVKKKSPATKKAGDSPAAKKPAGKNPAAKKVRPATSQTGSKKVTNHQGSKKTTAETGPEGRKQIKTKSPAEKAPEKEP